MDKGRYKIHTVTTYVDKNKVFKVKSQPLYCRDVKPTIS